MSCEPRSSWKQSGRRVGALPVGEEAEVADAYETAWQQVEQERRRNSSIARVMILFLLPWTESRQRKVKLPSERATNLRVVLDVVVTVKVARKLVPAAIQKVIHIGFASGLY